jgi:4-hydroxy-tetrahydrodipicolinate synthase
MISQANPASWLTGYIADLPTPFEKDAELDLDAFAALCERQINAGASAIIVGETAGEAPTLTTAERLRLFRCAVDTAQGRARIIAGAGSNSTDRAIELPRQAERAGTDAVLSVAPYYNKPMQEGMVAHFRAVAASTTLPVILHDIPARTARELTDTTVERLADSAQFIGLRDGAGDVARPVRLRPRLPPRFRLLTGDDATAPAYMMAGEHGCMSALANVIPGVCQAICVNLSEGRLQSARLLSSRLSPISELLAADHPAALKYVLALLGLIRPDTRLPLVPLDETAKPLVEAAIVHLSDEDLVSPRRALPATPVRDRACSELPGDRS